MNAIVPLPDEDENVVVVVPMLTISQAVGLYVGDLQRRGYSPRTINTYERLLDKFADAHTVYTDVSDVKPDDCRRFLDRWNRRSQGTKCHTYTVLFTFFEWLDDQGRIRKNPLDRVPRPKRIPPQDLDVTLVSTAEVQMMLRACRTWTETLAVAIPAYMGPRRHAAALLRLRDYDQLHHRIRFREKGAKTIWKPVPDELAHLLRLAIADGAIPTPDSYLIPPEGPLVRSGDRDDRVVWRVVKRVADRAGVEAHVHALRAAFATFYLEQNIGDLEALQALMGHKDIETTNVYLRKLNRDAAMERVRTLSWAGNDAGGGIPQLAGITLASSPVVGAGGFEPPFGETPHQQRAGSERGDACLDEALNQAVRARPQRAREACAPRPVDGKDTTA